MKKKQFKKLKQRIRKVEKCIVELQEQRAQETAATNQAPDLELPAAAPSSQPAAQPATSESKP